MASRSLLAIGVVAILAISRILALLGGPIRPAELNGTAIPAERISPAGVIQIAPPGWPARRTSPAGAAAAKALSIGPSLLAVAVAATERIRPN
jgi:hypothetical protein